MNWQPERALEYHEATKHRPGDTLGRRVPASIIPRTHKLYDGLDAIPLPEPARSSLPALSVLAGTRGETRTFGLATISALLHFSAGITRRATVQGREMEFRAASCTGALYHVETYVVTAAIDGLEAGVYHFGVHDSALRRLRAGDYRATVHAALCALAPDPAPKAYLVHTSTWWRNAWRYEDRAYRHTFWDAGTIIANLLAVADAHGIAAALTVGFMDGLLNDLLGVDPRKEAAVSIVGLGEDSPAAPASSLETLSLPVVPLSPVEIEYPAITGLHEASSLERCDDLERWHEETSSPSPSPLTLRLSSAQFPRGTEGVRFPLETIETVIEHRGSARRFRGGISQAALITILDAACGKNGFDHGQAPLVEPFLIVNGVDGLSPGAYGYDPASRRVRQVRSGEFREAAAHLALDQPAAGVAAVNLYFLAPLRQVLDRLGNRGYRAAQLEAGIRGGRAYLSAYALGLKATGLTFYDDDVIEFFGDAAAEREVMFLVVFGR
jgi:SagB-type dehydrogenase family enzyme